MFRIVSILILTMALAAPAQAGFKEGGAAYNRGDYETAQRERHERVRNAGARQRQRRVWLVKHQCAVGQARIVSSSPSMTLASCQSGNS